MLEVTQSAGKAIKIFLEHRDSLETHSMRLTVRDGDLAIVLDEPVSGDISFLEGDDQHPLVVAEPALAERLEGYTLDYQSESSQLVIK